MNLSGLAGNESIKTALSAAMSRSAFPHALIISGAEGSGKRTLAGILSCALVCSSAGERPCLTCPHCKKAQRGIHPDIMTVDAGGKEIVVSQIRDQLRPDVWVRPNEAAVKVYIILHAQDMNVHAQNALLNVLEEPPAYAVFFLLAENPDALLPTVRSRCVELSMQPLSPEQALPVLTARFPDAPPARVREAFSMAGGILGRAAGLLNAADAPAFPSQAREFARILSEGGELSLFEYCLGLEKLKREEFTGFLDALAGLYHQAILIKAGSLAPAHGDDAMCLCAALSKSQLLSLMELTQKIRAYCAYNTGIAHLSGMLSCLSACVRAGGCAEADALSLLRKE